MTTDPSTRVLMFDAERSDAPPLPEEVVRTLAAKDVVLLLAAPAARRDRWAARAAIALAAQVAGAGRKVVLADLSFNDGILHELLGVPNGEGLADVFLFGASAEHVALPVPGASFALIPAGAYVPDEAEVFGHSAWSPFLAQLKHDGELLFAFAPDDAPGVTRLPAPLATAVVLADHGEAEAALQAAARRLEVLNVLARPPVATQPPHDAADTPAEAAVSERTFERVRLPRDREREALIADLRTRQRAERLQPEPVLAELHTSPLVGGPEAPRISEPPARSPQREARPHRRRTPLLLTLALILFVSAIAGVWHFSRVYMRGRQVAATDVAQQPAPGAAQPLTGEPAGEPLPYSVAIEAHQDLPTAVRRITSLGRADTTTGFYIAPILVDSALYYRVMAGPVADSAAAAGVMQWLIRRGLKTGGSEWDIRATPYAFLLGEYELREQAEQRMEQIHALNIPSYVIEVPYTNGPPRYYLYSGAYSGAAEAELMRQLLRNAGLATNLVERTGRSSS